MIPLSREGVVILGFAEAISAPEVVWSLVDFGFQPIAFSRKGRHGCLRHSRHVRVYEITAPENDCEAALEDLTALLESVGNTIDGHHVLLPIDDASIWLCSQIDASSSWILAGPRGGCAELALNKEKQIQAATA